MPNTLYLRLEGPLQSWGGRGRWSIRDSAPAPTKSGVVGLLGCALGVGDDATLRRIGEETQMAVRIDRPGIRLTDYHTIGGGYDEPALLTAQGKPKKSSGRPHTEISYRDYLCDAAFTVALWSTDTVLIDTLATGVQQPVWTLYLGRKSCPLSQPPYLGTAKRHDLEDAIRQAPAFERTSSGVAGLRVILETTPDLGVMRRDQLISRRFRRYAPRYTREIVVPIPKASNT